MYLYFGDTLFSGICILPDIARSLFLNAILHGFAANNKEQIYRCFSSVNKIGSSDNE